MANLDAVFDANSPHHSGNYFVVTGTIAATQTANETRLAPASGTILYCNMHNTSDDATGDIRVQINTEDDQSTASQGLVATQAEANTDVFRFEAGVIL